VIHKGDLVQFTRVGYNYVYGEVRIGIFLSETDHIADPPRDLRRYVNILDQSGEVVETYNYLKINYECR